MSSSQLSRSEVKKHRSRNSLWIIIHNDVYDVTTFIDEHPGGADSLLEVGGADATQAFEDVGHSKDAREMLKKYKIGYVPPGERTSYLESCSNLKWYLLALAAAILMGIAVKKYMNK